MAVAVAAAAVGLLTVLVALYRDGLVAQPQPATPDWGPLPAPADLARVEFPTAVPGYEPAAVEVVFETLVRAYEELLAESPPAVRLRAWRRGALRLGLDPDDPPAHVAAGPPAGMFDAGPAADGDDGLEALRVAAALGALERRTTDPADG